MVGRRLVVVLAMLPVWSLGACGRGEPPSADAPAQHRDAAAEPAPGLTEAQAREVMERVGSVVSEKTGAGHDGSGLAEYENRVEQTDPERDESRDP